MGSIAYFYPENAIRVIADTDIAKRDILQMHLFPNTSVFRVMDLVAKHGHCLIKLLAQFNALFMEDLNSVVVLDADIIMVAPILEQLDSKPIFIALSGGCTDYENNPKTRASFSRWAYDTNLAESFGFESSHPIKYFIQSCAYQIDTKRFPIDALLRALPHLQPTHSLVPGPFQAGDQGFLTWLANSKEIPEDKFQLLPLVLELGVKTPHVKDLDDINYVEKRQKKSYGLIHFVGSLRRYRFCDNEYGAVLNWAARQYYKRIKGVSRELDEVYRFAATGRRAFRLLIKSIWPV